MPEKSVSSDSLAMETKQSFSGKKLRMAIIGCGGISQMHMGVLKDFPDVEVVAGVDTNPERLTVMRDKWGVAQTFSDWKTMLKQVQPDAVNICTPNGVHAAPAIDAANAGCHVIVEKPMAMDPKQCQKMIDTSKKAGKKLVIGFQYRYHPRHRFSHPRARRRRVRQCHVRQMPGPPPPRYPQLGRLRPKGSPGRRPDDRHRRTRY